MRTIYYALLFCFLASLTNAQPPQTRNNAQYVLNETKWVFNTGGKIFASPTIANGVLFAGSEDQYLYAIETGSGKLKWKFKTGGAIHSTVHVDDGFVYFGSFDGNYYALNASNGKKIWSFKTGGEKWMGGKGYFGKPDSVHHDDPWEFYLSSPVTGKIKKAKVVYFGSSDGNIYAVDAKNGKLIWKYQTGGLVHSSPVLSEGMLYVGSWDAHLYAIDANTGQLKWKFKTGEQPAMTGIQATPLVSNGTVYFGARDTNFYALNAGTGEVKWKYSAGISWILSNAILRDNTLYFGTSDSFLVVALDASTGKEKWTSALNGYVYSTPALWGSTLFVGDFTGKIYSLETTTGHISSNFSTPGHKQLAKTILNEGKLDVGKTGEGKDFSLFATAKFVMDEFYKLGPIVSTPAVGDNTLFVSSSDGNIYAIALAGL